MKKIPNFCKMTCISMAALAMLGCTTLPSLTPEPENISAKNAIQWRQDFDYSIEGHIIARPTQAFTDGKNTYLQFRDRQPIGKITDGNGKAVTVRDGNSYKEVVGIYPVLLINLANQYNAKVTYNAFAAQAVAVTPAPTLTPTPTILPIAAPSAVLVPSPAPVPVTTIAPTSIVKQAAPATANAPIAAPVIAVAETLKPKVVNQLSVASVTNPIAPAAPAAPAASVAINTGVRSSVSTLPAAPQALVPASNPAPVQIPVFSVTNESTTLEVLYKWANKVGYQLIVNGQTAGKQFPGIHPVAYVDLPLLPAHKTISARSVSEGGTALSKVYSDAKVNLDGIEFFVGVVDSKKTIEVKAIQTSNPVVKPIPIQKVAEPIPAAPVVQANTTAKPVPVALPVAAPVAVQVAPYGVTAKDQGLITLLTRWAQQAGFTTTINGETVAYATFPVMKTPAAINAIEFPLASGLTTFKSQASFFEAVKVVFQSYTGSEQLPKDFTLNINPSQKVLSIQSPTKAAIDK